MSDALPLIRSHLAAGEGWTLSWAIDAGAPRLVVILAGAELATARQWLAVAGSVAGRHLAEAVEVVALGDGSVAAVFAAPAGPSLAELLRRRDTLTGGELVTLLAPLAETLAGLHARGLAPAAITAETVWLADDGRPLLVPVGFLEHPDADAGLLALVDLGRSALDRSSRVASRLATALDAAADGRLDAGGLAAVLLRATSAVPIRKAAGAAEAQRRPWRSHGRGVIAIALAVAVAIGIGAASSRRDGSGTVLAAPDASIVGSPSASPTSWLSVMADLERARARAYATGDPAMLDEVYAPGSPQGDADRTQLRRLAREGRRAAGLRAFVEAVRAVSVGNVRTTLTVTDALTAYDVVGAGGQVMRRGSGRPSRMWTVTLVRGTTGWRVWSVRPASRQSPITAVR